MNQIDHLNKIDQLFWDIDPKKLDIKRHKRFIVERILPYGTPYFSLDKQHQRIFENPKPQM